MPQPIHRNISTTVDMAALRKRPQLTRHIVEITCLWHGIEDELATIFAVASLMVPAVAAAVLGRIQNLASRLEMTDTALGLSFPPEAASKFRGLKKTIRRRAGERNNVVHCHWLVHDDYPNHLIHFKGLSDPKLTFIAWDEQDFLGVQLRLAELQIALKQFLAELPPYLDNEAHLKSHWRYSEPQQKEQDQEPPPDQKKKPSGRPQ